MPKFIDIKGKQFGDWTAIEYLGSSEWLCEDSKGNRKKINSYELRNKYTNETKPKGIMPEGFLHKKINHWYINRYLGGGFWECICDCGETAKVNSYDLKHNKSTQCKKCSERSKFAEDLTGKTFGLWKVIEYAGNMRWHCVCGCDKHTEKNVLGRDLRNGTSKSCGCNRNYHIIHKDITGKTFGSLYVVGYTGENQMWQCKCLACGKDNVIVFRDSLVSGKTKSCGCLKEKLRKETLLAKYGDSNTTRLNKPRKDWQIQTIENPDKLAEYIRSLSHKPTAFELSMLLDVHDTTMLKALRKFELMDLIEDVNAGTSSMEKQLVDYVKQFGYEIIQRNKSVISPFELDIYIPDKKIAIEFNGDYWHSTLFKDSKYHQEKTIACIQKGIHLIHIFEYEWLDNTKRTKILNYIKHLLKGGDKVYGRHTEICEIPNKDAFDFCEQYHLQGGINSNINLGCTYNGEIIGVMTFGKPRFSSTEQYELLRLCWKPEYTVLGGTEKLFKSFIDSFKPDSILTYCDLTKFSGDAYLRLNFKTKAEWLTKPNYVWVSKRADLVLPRYRTQKHLLIEEGLGNDDDTEDDIMYSNGYMKIYNSGNIKLVWNKTSK